MKLLPYVIAALTVAGLVAVAYGVHTSALKKAQQAGYTEAAIQCIQAIDKAMEDASKARSKIEYRNIKLSDPDIDSKLSAHWLRVEN